MWYGSSLFLSCLVWVSCFLIDLASGIFMGSETNDHRAQKTDGKTVCFSFLYISCRVHIRIERNNLEKYTRKTFSSKRTKNWEKQTRKKKQRPRDKRKPAVYCISTCGTWENFLFRTTLFIFRVASIHSSSSSSSTTASFSFFLLVATLSMEEMAKANK